MNIQTATPVEIDTKIAALHHSVEKVERSLGYAFDRLHDVAKTRTYVAATYARKSHYAYSATNSEAIELVTAALEAAKADNYSGPMRSYDLLYGGIDEALKNIPQLTEQSADIWVSIDALEAEHDRRKWTRFFLVTSSAGHVHSSRGCSTCRVTTQYGWMPELSGKTEEVAVAELGSVLCSVCFPSAPVAMTGGKITKARAAKLAA